MKGLLCKDFMLMLNQKQFFLVLIGIALVMTFTLDDISFIIGYLAIVIQMFTISSISYDEYDNGYAFMFTLPISRKIYVQEKYLFGILMSIIGVGSAFLITLIYLCFSQQLNELVDLTILCLTYIPVLFVFISLMIPIQLKFGGEKGRMAFVGIVGVIFLLGYLLWQMVAFFQIDFSFVMVLLNQVNNLVLYLISILIGCILIFISSKISEHILLNKEF
ncbi:MAG: ABC-2 transporter permease [Traorella sp.]